MISLRIIRKIVNRFLIFLHFSLLFFVFQNCYAVDSSTITPTKAITDSQTLTSRGGVFKLGFFSPPNSTHRYVGIWYEFDPRQNIVWVANRDNPLRDSSGTLRIADDGNLVIVDGRGVVFWNTNVSGINAPNNSVAELLDTGNLEFRLLNESVWQSFDHPTHTFLPGMEIGGSTLTGKKLELTSWKSESDPSTGIFSLMLELLGDHPQLVVRRNGSNSLLWRSGPWNSIIFIGIPEMTYAQAFSLSEDNTYISFKDPNKLYQQFALDHHGAFLGKQWDADLDNWYEFWSSQNNICDTYGMCGPFGSCNPSNSPICSCLIGFKPKFEDEWSKGNWSGGCVRNTQLECQDSGLGNLDSVDGFQKLESVKVPDNAIVSLLSISLLEDSRMICLRNCSCLAYSFDIGVGCMTWDENLVDIQQFNQRGADLYIRLAHSDIDLALKNSTDPAREDGTDHGLSKNGIVIIVIIAVLVGMVAISICAYLFWKWLTKQKGYFASNWDNFHEETPDDPDQLKVFKFQELATATNNFNGANMLGQGGFGQVYKGTLSDGQEIAVKRLSKGSIQGLGEFKNEVIVISKVQHRNLVRLLGCCLEGEEKMLIYEYMPNKSLDAFLFDPTKRELLDWKKRFQIIEGISRGMLYLHRDSRLRVIHRDLKASNVLLDEDLNPKISDFGMARIFGGNEQQASTGRVVGTLGYMPPEYIMDGRFSEKSDVFSFGVLLLEVVSGRKTTSFHHLEQSLSLLGYAWQLWNESKMELLIDPAILNESTPLAEIFRCIQVGLLCVQECARDRPTMSTTLSMLTSEITTLPTPKQPAFMERRVSTPLDSFAQSTGSASVNHLTITHIEGR
ncbi:G-type lectin S-receptor-like serine/threonine-protein kinase SD1-13 isoform X1 [Papaver somniferum]|uniref:G-type lectin S-receptor-like serine/threonine-protein kinase SD1-13 isoform X1 n=1 Tax=Papaver somniferum TaxID=3469 RepID=UPI000E703CB2|nr:G-type lectin S-receptor-like serine/threonine-protein kinase SD1-13 isoform X1 [Papaver somniferum]